MLRAFQTIFAAVLLLGLAACARHLTDANLHEVKSEMTTKEVESILGPPNRIEATLETPPAATTEAEAASAARSSGPSSSSMTRYTYVQGDRTVTLTFAGDRLIPSGVSGSFE